MFTREHAFDVAVRSMGEVAAALPIRMHDALRFVFDRVAKYGAMPVETAWRMMRAAELCPEMQKWEQRDLGEEIPLVCFVTVAAALIPIADKQQAAFEQVQRALQAEARMSGMNRARARRRERKAARMAKRPDAIRKYLAVKAANAQTRKPGTPATRAQALKAEKDKPPAPPPPAPTKTGSRKKGGK